MDSKNPNTAQGPETIERSAPQKPDNADFTYREATEEDVARMKSLQKDVLSVLKDSYRWLSNKQGHEGEEYFTFNLKSESGLLDKDGNEISPSQIIETALKVFKTFRYRLTLMRQGVKLILIAHNGTDKAYATSNTFQPIRVTPTDLERLGPPRETSAATTETSEGKRIADYY